MFIMISRGSWISGIRLTGGLKDDNAMQECYKAIVGNYEAVLGRLHSEAVRTHWKGCVRIFPLTVCMRLVMSWQNFWEIEPERSRGYRNQTLLSDEGANLTVAEDGLQAVRMFQEKPEGYFDAILMDIMMPVMDGITATKTIRSLKHPDAETIPIIAMTAN